MEFESASLRAIARMNPALLDQAREKLGIDKLVPEAIGPEQIAAATRAAAPRVPTDATLQSFGGIEDQPPEPAYVNNLQFEAIVLAVIRPPLLVLNGTFVPPADPVPAVRAIVNGLKRATVDPVIARTARVDLLRVPGIPFVGTAWIVEKKTDTTAIMVTNRHVAAEFADADGRGGYAFRLLPNFSEYQANVDFMREHGSPAERIAVVRKVVFMAGSRAPDIALLEVEGEELKGLDMVNLSPVPLKKGDPIAVVGYPAYDSRSDPEDVAAYFGTTFDVKRFAFGDVTGFPETTQFTHDATTLGGNSGSVVFHRDSGQAVGLHFAGDYKRANYAVRADEIAAALKGLRSFSVVSSHAAATEARGDGRNAPAHFRGRDGYDPAFLGHASPVPPPAPGPAWQADLAELADADTGQKTGELKYRHFSVWMTKSRKLPLVTAVNIDGNLSKRLGRIDKWYIDGRLGDAFQVDNAAYAGNPLDRGHMVRREDPVWGDLAAATEANRDTFHYTNAAPQHEALNQRDWLNLEDYILGNARTRGLKVSVFTGPVLAEGDPPYRGGIVRLPRAFWKIAALVNAESGALSVTGYLLCQGDLIQGLTGEFVYGPFRTYQVEVARIGELARIDVSALAIHDPLATRRMQEGLAADRGSFRAINGTADLVI